MSSKTEVTGTRARRSPTLSGIGAVLRHEWRRLLYTPFTHVFVAGFLLTLSTAVMLVGDLYASDVASLDMTWTFLPWVAVVLVPALAMRAFLDEPGERALELTLTMPLPTVALVIGKWLAGVLLLGIALVLAVTPLALTIGYLGDPDWGVAMSGAAGAALLLATFYAVALLAASLGRDQVSAYVLGLGALIALLLIGWDLVPRLMRGLPGGGLVDILAMTSPKHWLDRMAAGRIEPGALVYFPLAIGLALAGATRVISARGSGASAPVARLAGALAALALVLAGIGLVAAAARAPLIVDATAAGELTLHPETVAVARELPAGVEARLYWSASEASVPQSIRRHARRTRELLEAIARQSNGRLAVSEHDAMPDTDAEVEGLAEGIAKVPMSSGDTFLLGIALRQGERRLAIPYLDIARDGHLEYDVALAISNLARERPRRIGILTPLLSPRHTTESREGLAFLTELKRAYDVAVVPHFAEALPEGLDALVAVNPIILKPAMLYAIDQHVMAGKGLVVMLDAYLRFDRAQNVAVPTPSEAVDDLSDLLARYGLAFDGANVVGDLTLAAPVRQSDEQTIAYPFWLRLSGDSLSREHPVTANLNELLLGEPGSFRILPGSTARPLLTTTSQSGTLPRDTLERSTPEALAAGFATEGGERILAAATDGALASAFGTAPAATTAASPGQPEHLATSKAAPGVFAIADADWIFDPFAFQQVEADGKAYARPLNDNIAFLLNMVEAAAGDPRLLAIRSRGRVSRPFTKVAELLRQSQIAYKDRETGLVAAIARVESSIAKVMEITGAQRESELAPEVRAKLGELRSRLLPIRRELRQLRLQMREDVVRLGRMLTLFNLLAGPALALGLLGLARLLRARRRGTRKAPACIAA